MNTVKDTCVKVAIGNSEIILIGTAHVSRESITEVSQVIREEKPCAVCVELDEGRFASITQKDNWEKLNMVKVFREGKGFLLMANLVLSSFQRRLGDELGVKPGEEMKTAVETAQEMGIRYVLCDREVQTTLRRAWGKCGLWNKCKLLSSLVASAFSTEKLSEEEVEKLKKRNELDGMMAELSDYLPQVKTTLIDERDRYLAAKIWSSCTEAEKARTGEDAVKIAAVVGAGHLLGIKTHIEKIAAGEESVDVSDLETIPPKTFPSQAAGWIVPLIIAAIIVLGFFRAGADLSFSLFLRWILWNGSLSAIGCIIALGHPLSVLVSFIGAPIATINPFIGVGLFSGVTEATVRKPRVSDAETISDALSSLKGIYENRITKALLVFFLSSIGGMIGNFISIPTMFASLFRNG
ncbi:MAG: TraB/GumN family protein [Treponema sp.]|jgi:pheromone shutdown-related protein TraB|nr:TraB/GumN family protein [Treponema sp.]